MLRNLSFIIILVCFSWGYAVPSLTAPTPGGALPYPNTGTVTFTFDDVALMTVAEYQLNIGTCSAGSCSYNIYRSSTDFGPIVADVSGTTMHTVTVVPTDGSHIFVSLWYKEVGGTFTKIVYEYEATGDPSINAPTSGSTFSYNRATFVWDSNFAPVAEYNLIVGTTSGGSDIADSGTLTSATESLLVNKDNTTPPFVGLPTDGSTIFVNLGFNTSIGAPFTYVEFTYTAAGGSIVPPTISSPSPGSTLTSSSITFTVATPLDPAITSLKAKVKVNRYGPFNDIFGLFDIPLATPTFTVDPTTTNFPFVGIPNDGSTLFVELYYVVGGITFTESISYTADTAATLPYGRTFKTGGLNDLTTVNSGLGVDTVWLKKLGVLNTVAVPAPTAFPFTGSYGADTNTVLSTPTFPIAGISESFITVGLVHEYTLADAGDSLKLSYSIDGGAKQRFASFAGASMGQLSEGVSFPTFLLVGTTFQIHLELISDGAGVDEGWIVDTLVVAPSVTGVGSIVVTTAADGVSVPGSLREAVGTANAAGAGLITFDPSLTGSTITLTEGQIEVDDGVSIIGLGPTALTVDGGSSERIFEVLPGASAAISGIELSGGFDSGFGGGAIRNSGTLSISGCTFTGNSATSKGGGILNSEGATLTVAESSFVGNSSSLEGGALYNKDTSSMTITNSTFDSNIAGSHGGAIAIANAASGPFSISNSTLSGNMSTGNGGGIHANSTVVVTNCTFIGNSGSRGGGIYARTGTTTISNTIVALNTSVIANPDTHGSIYVSAGSNFVGIIGAAVGFGAAGDMIGTAGSPLDPLLGALAANGGPTSTHLPTSGSPVVDGSLGTSLLVDQRGEPRPSGAFPDIGSVERQPTDP